MLLCDDSRCGLHQALDVKNLQAAIEEDNILTCDELAKQFNVFIETGIYHLHRLSTTYRLSKWASYALFEVHKTQ